MLVGELGAKRSPTTRGPRFAAQVAMTALLALAVACSSTTYPPRYHVARAGETLESVAVLYGIDSWELARANHLEVSESVAAGTRLFIPYDMSKLRGFEASRMKVPLPQGFSFQWPLAHNAVNDYFGWRKGRMHEGLDLKARIGTPVFAAADGKILFAGIKYRAYGKIVVIQHSEEWSSVYAHLNSFMVSSGRQIRRGEMIGYSGRTGRVSGPHLHFELRKGSDPVDPLLFMPPLTP